jgi:DNA-binding MarR family transcriptional regulator
VVEDAPLVDPQDDIGLLCSVVGDAANQTVLAHLRASGFGDVRISHGYVFQGLHAGDATITELADRLGISVQAVSKSVNELEGAGYLRRRRSTEDGRARTIHITPRGRRMIAASRVGRRRVTDEIGAALGERGAAELTALLRRAVAHFERADAIAGRRLRPPD